jgi:hypothetical protein
MKCVVLRARSVCLSSGAPPSSAGESSGRAIKKPARTPHPTPPPPGARTAQSWPAPGPEERTIRPGIAIIAKVCHLWLHPPGPRQLRTMRVDCVCDQARVWSGPRGIADAIVSRLSAVDCAAGAIVADGVPRTALVFVALLGAAQQRPFVRTQLLGHTCGAARGGGGSLRARGTTYRPGIGLSGPGRTRRARGAPGGLSEGPRGTETAGDVARARRERPARTHRTGVTAGRRREGPGCTGRAHGAARPRGDGPDWALHA